MEDANIIVEIRRDPKLRKTKSISEWIICERNIWLFNMQLLVDQIGENGIEDGTLHAIHAFAIIRMETSLEDN